MFVEVMEKKIMKIINVMGEPAIFNEILNITMFNLMAALYQPFHVHF